MPWLKYQSTTVTMSLHGSFRSQLFQSVQGDSSSPLVEARTDTSDLGLRIGIHSAVTARRVLRGDQARFHMFGDTFNTAARGRKRAASRMCSCVCADGDYPEEFWKSLLARPSRGKDQCQGQGFPDYLLAEFKCIEGTVSTARRSEGTSSSDNDHSHTDNGGNGDDTIRDPIKQFLVVWNSELLGKLLKRVVAQRKALNARPTAPFRSHEAYRTNSLP